jgi:hypothetical protein
MMQYCRIYCIFGMKGAIAKNHPDCSHNFVALLGGEL